MLSGENVGETCRMGFEQLPGEICGEFEYRSAEYCATFRWVHLKLLEAVKCIRSLESIICLGCSVLFILCRFFDGIFLENVSVVK